MSPLRRALYVIPVALCLAIPAAAQSLTGRVVAVHDGDTVTVRTDKATVRIRLVGIDCPEYKQPFSSRARQFTSRLVFGKTVDVRGEGYDRYNRLLGRIYVDGTDVNLALVRAGLAWHFDESPATRDLALAEREARAGRLGLWATPNPVPPWRWRRQYPRTR